MVEKIVKDYLQECLNIPVRLEEEGGAWKRICID